MTIVRGLTQVSVVAALLAVAAGCGTNDGRGDLAAVGEMAQASPTALHHNADGQDALNANGITVAWTPPDFVVTSSDADAQDLDPGQGGESRFVYATYEPATVLDGPASERPDLSIIVSEDLANPLAGAQPVVPEGEGFRAEAVTLTDGTLAVLSYSESYRYGSVDFVAADHVTVTITGGPMAPADLVRVANSLSFDRFVSCSSDRGWDSARIECRPRTE